MIVSVLPCRAESRWQSALPERASTSGRLPPDPYRREAIPVPY
ncbi:MAG: hypothetical protein ABW185_21985 [Sedimenticola sp.]